jgi:hypothetical protein
VCAVQVLTAASFARSAESSAASGHRQPEQGISKEDCKLADPVLRVDVCFKGVSISNAKPEVPTPPPETDGLVEEHP